jgi:hypothetical protein
MKQHLAIAVTAAALAACAAPVEQVSVTPVPQPQAQTAFDPVGTYDFTTEFQGASIRGVLYIRRGEQGLTGTMATELTGDLPLSRVAFEGRRGEFRASTDQGELIMRMDFQDDDRFTGGWELSAGLSGGVSGQRRR